MKLTAVTFRYLAATVAVVVLLVVVAVLVVMTVMAMDINTVKRQVSKLKVYQRYDRSHTCTNSDCSADQTPTTLT
jgi:uncharacterized membrane protein